MASRSKDSNRPTGGTVAEPTSAQGKVSDRENRLAEGLQSAGLLSPLLSALIEQREQGAEEPGKTSDNSTSEPAESYVRRALREANPALSEHELSELESIM